jgi:hypothetical protein
VGQRLAEAETGIDEQVLLPDTGTAARRETVGEERADLEDDVVVVRIGLHRLR